MNHRRIWAAAWVGFLLGLVVTQAHAAGPGSAAPHLNWYGLSAEAARKSLPVEWEGTVLCYDAGWGQLFIYDGLNALYFSPLEFTNRFNVGDRVKIRGLTAWNGTAAVLTNLSARVIGQESLPPAGRRQVGDLANTAGQWLELRGRVVEADASQGRVTFVLNDNQRKCVVYVMQTSGTSQFKQLADATVILHAINASRQGGGKLEEAVLVCPGFDQISIVNGGLENRWRLPATPIATLLARPPGNWTNQAVHLTGLVTACQPGARIAVKDPTGALWAEVRQVNPAALNQNVDLWGFLSVRTNQTVLADAYFEINPQSPAPAHPAAGSPPVTTNGLTTIHEVRLLSKFQANQKLPATVRGVVTFVDSAWRLAFVQDRRDAIFIETTQSDFEVGQYVEVTGQTDGGGYAPELVNCAITDLGMQNFPTALKIDLQDTANGRLDSRWVQMEGVVRSVTKDNGRITVALTSREGEFTAMVLDFNTNAAPTALIDSLVSIRGACGSVVNSRGQLSGITLHVPDLDEIQVIDPSPADPFAMAATPISAVATFNPDLLAGRRVKVGGVVTLVRPGQDLFLQDASGGIRVVTAQTNHFEIGDHLTVLGFPALRDFSPFLEGAIVRPDGTAALPAPRAARAEYILAKGKLDGMRVELSAQVVQDYDPGLQPRMMLQDGPVIFTAQAAPTGRPGGLPRLKAGSMVNLCGICVIQGDQNNEPSSFRLLLTGPQDVVLTEAAPWLTTTYAVYLLGGLLLVALLASLWGFVLRRQVRRQTEIIRQNQQELMEASRFAGMAEIATNVLHNVGNVLNSVNVSAAIVSDKIRESKALDGLWRAVGLMEEHREDLGVFISRHPQGSNLPGFLKQVAERLRADKEAKIKELGVLRKNIEHINEIVAMQLKFAKVEAKLETVSPLEIMEDALSMDAADFARLGIEVKREYGAAAKEIKVDKHKLLQILVNLISNARNACLESAQPAREIVLRVACAEGKVEMSVEDNGVGIAADNLVRIFNHGFTTRKTGHGFGLHSGALAARQLGGRLSVHSDGPGLGARFTLELPLVAPGGGRNSAAGTAGA